MSVTFSLFQTVELARNKPLARVTAGGQGVTIYPEGLGMGPSLTLTVDEWNQVRAAVDAAIARGWEPLSGYTAIEGNGEAL